MVLPETYLYLAAVLQLVHSMGNTLLFGQLAVLPVLFLLFLQLVRELLGPLFGLVALHHELLLYFHVLQVFLSEGVFVLETLFDLSLLPVELVPETLLVLLGESLLVVEYVPLLLETGLERLLVVLGLLLSQPLLLDVELETGLLSLLVYLLFLLVEGLPVEVQ